MTAPYNDNGLITLQENFGAVIYRPWKPHGRAYYAEELTALLQSTAANALITEHDHVTADVINANPHLKFIGVCRGTPSNVSIETATKHNIPVFYTPCKDWLVRNRAIKLSKTKIEIFSTYLLDLYWGYCTKVKVQSENA